MRVAALLLVGLLLTGCEDEITDETGKGTVMVHVFMSTGGAAGGVSTYIIKDAGSQQTERRTATDQNGNATYTDVPAGSWDVGWSEDGVWMFSSAGLNRRTVDVRDDATTEVTFTAVRR